MTIFYVSSFKTKQIFVWKINEYNSSLELTQKVNTPGHCQPIAIHPNKKNLYVGISPNFSIINYKIDDFGSLKEKSSTKFPSKLTHIFIDKNGNFLFGSSFQGNCLYISRIHDDKTIEFPNKILSNLQGCHFSYVNSNDKNLWTTCLKADKILTYSMYEMYQKRKFNVYLKYIIKSNIGSGPRHIAFYKSYAYISNELNGTISVVEIHNEFAYIIQTVNIIPFNCNGIYWTSDIHIDEQKKRLYCCDRNYNVISCFKIKKNGFLSFYFYKKTETQPREFDIDSKKKYLVVAGQKSNCISVYKIDPNTGYLTNLGSYNSGTDPIWISFL